MIASTDRKILVSLDGGITRANIEKIAATGVDIVVTGSAIFDGEEPTANARFMLERVTRK